MEKQELWAIIEMELKKQISEITSNLNTIEQSKTQETKSSAGDKFETGRAMMQIEEDKLLGQLKRKKEYHVNLLKLPFYCYVYASHFVSIISFNKILR